MRGKAQHKLAALQLAQVDNARIRAFTYTDVLEGDSGAINLDVCGRWGRWRPRVRMRKAYRVLVARVQLAHVQLAL